MTLSDYDAYRNVIGCLMKKPLLLLEYSDIQGIDFDYLPARIAFNMIRQFYQDGATALTVIEIDQEIARRGGNAEREYKNNNGLEFLKEAYQQSNEASFEPYYKRLKKCSLLRRLQRAHYDISYFYIDPKDVKDPRIEAEIIKRFDEATLEDILNEIEKNYSEIRNDVLHGGRKHGDPAEGLIPLIDKLKTTPSVGEVLEGEIFNAVCRGARLGCFYLKSASTSGGKSRTSVFDACRLAYPKRWSHKEGAFVEELTLAGEPRAPRKVLFIVTEMDREELQTIMLAYLSGINEDKILTGNYETPMEEHRVRAAARIMEEYSGYFIIEEISEPNLQNIEATIRKYATVDEVKYVFFDYIHTTASLVEQFTRNNLREDVVLMLLANQLKQLAKDYNLFIFSATQVNAFGIGDEEMEFRDEKSIRGSKAVADKCDMGYVMSRIPDKFWGSIKKQLEIAVREKRLDPSVLEERRPTHILDIYKMRRGRYKMVRIWTRLDLGTGEREDIFMTDAVNQPIDDSTIYRFNTNERVIKEEEK